MFAARGWRGSCCGEDRNGLAEAFVAGPAKVRDWCCQGLIRDWGDAGEGGDGVHGSVIRSAAADLFAGSELVSRLLC